MKTLLSAEEVLKIIQTKISDWHSESIKRPSDYVIVTDKMKKRRNFGEYRENMEEIVADLALDHTEMWHIEDRIHSGDSKLIVPAVRNVNIMNVYRNSLVEELDELFLNFVKKKEG